MEMIQLHSQLTSLSVQQLFRISSNSKVPNSIVMLAIAVAGTISLM
jgi:hypothetical protein